MRTIKDLTVTMQNYAMDPNVPKITHMDHEENIRRYAKKSGKPIDQVAPCGATDHVVTLSHANTHVDAPWHFGPTVDGKLSKTIDEVPLDWCYSNGVLLDFSATKKPNEIIDINDLKRELGRIDYELKPMDIVLIHTGAEDYFETDPRFADMASGLGLESLTWLLDQRIKHIATDAYTLDIPLRAMCEKLKKGENDAFFPVHLAGRKIEYIHSEKLCGLKSLSKPSGFKVIIFPIKLKGGAGSWTRAVAIEDEGVISKRPELIDLSVPIMNQSMEREEIDVCHVTHAEGGRRLSKNFGVSCDLFPEPKILFANDEVSCSTHAGTHVNAPWHYAPSFEGQPSKTIDQVSLNQLYGDAVLLDFSNKKANDSITISDLKKEIGRINYELKQGDIVLIRTGAEEYFFNDPHFNDIPAVLSKDALVWLLNEGVNTIGTDADYTNRFPAYAAEGLASDFCLVEKLYNLKNIPRRFGFKVAMFPIKIDNCSAAWARAVAIL